MCQFTFGAGRIDDAQRLGDAGGVGDVAVAPGLIQRFGAVALMGEQEAVHLGDVHPLQQVRVGRVVVPPVGRRAMDAAMNSADPVHGPLRVVRGAVRRHREERAGALQPSPRVTAVVGMLGDARHRQGMQRLQQQGAQTSHEHRRVAVHPADGPIVGEPARAGGVVDVRAVGWSVGSGHQTEELAPGYVPQTRQTR